MDSGSFAYILVTPAKNEADNLPALIDSIARQNARPIAWFIVDDASEDGTPSIIDKASSEHSWIHSLRLSSKHDYAVDEHYAAVCVNGFNHALDYCRRNNIDFGYIALSDADMLYPEDYFEKCLSFLHDNRGVGIVSGRILVKDRQGHLYEQERIRLEGRPHGSGRIWRKEAFEDTEGYAIAKAPDTVSNVVAELKGWQVIRLPDIVCYQTRATRGKASSWTGYFQRGENAYYVSANPLSILNAVIDIILISRQKNCITKSLALLSGYWKSVLRREPQVDNDDIKRHIGSYRRVMKNYWVFLMRWGRKPS